jgi:hypothetical protein
MGMLIDSVKKYSDANNIALMLIGILLCNPFFPFRLSLFIDFTEHTLANLRHSYSNLLSCLCLLSQKRVGELNSRISSDITQIQDTLTSTIAEF